MCRVKLMGRKTTSILLEGPLRMLVMMLLSQFESHHPGPAIHFILWENDVAGIPEWAVF